MRGLLPLCLVLAACGVPAGLDPEGPVGQRRDAIIGGATNFTDPQVFYIEMTYAPDAVFSCTATLIGRRTLLTAAHCIAPDELGRKPTVEATNVPRVRVATDADWIKVLRQRYHPNYRSTAITDDYAVLELERNPFLKPREWNRTNLMSDVVDKIVRQVGYGITITEGTGAGVRRNVDLPINDLDPNLINSGTTNQKGTCSGDSGGPMFLRFPDGVERHVGVTSFHRGECGKNASARTDKGAAFIDQWFLDVEAPSCGEDGQCKTGCVPEDPDCACAADAMCNPLCATAAKDADCAESCAGGNVCSVTACATPDPDCQAFGAPCGLDEQCAGRRCITDPQHPQGYCSKACAVTADCPSDTECSPAGACTKLQRPTATEGQPCTRGQTFCDGPRLWCDGPEGKTECRRSCLFAADCPATESCTANTNLDAGATMPGVCVPNIVIPQLNQVGAAAKSCSAAPGVPLLLWAALALLRRRSVTAAR